MKSVQEYLLELDSMELVDTYYSMYSRYLSDMYYQYTYFSFQFPYDCTSMNEIIQEKSVREEKPDFSYEERMKEQTVLQFIQEELKALYDYIEYLKGINVSAPATGKVGVFYSYKKLEYDLYRECSDVQGNVRTWAHLLYMDELINDPENCSHISFSLADASEVLGFLVADNQYTQRNIYKVISCILHELALSGYRQEHLAKLRYFSEIANGKSIVYSHIDKDISYQKFDWKWNRYEDPLDGIKFLHDYYKARTEFEKCSMLNERRKIISKL